MSVSQWHEVATDRTRRIAGLAFGLSFSLVALWAQTTGRTAIPPDGTDPRVVCGTELVRHARAQATVDTAISNGEPLFFDQDPPLVFPSYNGPITLRNFNIVGDHATIQFRRYDPTSPTGRIETWQRLTSRTVAGRVVSIFEPSWPATELAASLAHYRIGVDQPNLYWGALVVPDTDTPVERPVRLRVGFDGIPTSAIVRVNDQVQYASDVINLVVPNFGDARVGGGQTTFELSAVTSLFYQYVADGYDVIALQPASITLGDFGAFHQNARNDVSGLNLSLFDQSSLYGSRGVLRGVEVYGSSNAARYEDTNHEMAHQWGSHFDWTRIAGITRAGWNPSSHAPLWTGGETLIGSVLFDDRRVRAGMSGYEIERTPGPARYHPIELYSMGVIGPEQVQDFAVFADQAQFGTTVTSPAAGTPVAGEARPVSISDVIREHGRRTGPSPSVWRRATVLVSRDRLVSQREMDYWNFFAQRLADRMQSNPPTYDGFAPFRVATRNLVSLSTLIQPLSGSALPEELDTSAPAFGVAEWRGVTFASPVPTHFRVGDVTLNGRVTATESVDFDDIALVLSKADGSKLRFDGDIRRSGDFAVTLRFRDQDRGQYSMSVNLFWPNSGPQFPRTTLSTITID
jgi:hypothetical protein